MGQAKEWIAQAEDGAIRNRSRDEYKPSTLRSYKSAMNLYVLDDLGGARIGDVTLGDVQALADRLLARKLDASTIRNAITPLRVIYGRAVKRGVVAVNPTTGLDLPAVRGTRDRVASAQEATKLLDALRPEDRALWATAIYGGGLRCGELQALRWRDVDLANGLLRVEWAYDPKEREYVAPKTRAGVRVVRSRLSCATISTSTSSPRPAARGISSSGGRPPRPSTARPCSGVPDEPGLSRSPRSGRWCSHEGRHTYVSLMSAAGFTLEHIGDYAGHSAAYMTERYRHLLEGHEREAAETFDAYLDRADTATRLAQMETR